MPSAVEVFRQKLIWLAAEADPQRIVRAGNGGAESEVTTNGSRFSHVADHYEVVAPVRGETHIALPDRVVRLEVGDLLLIERGVPHSEIAAETAQPYEVFWFHVRQQSALLTETRFVPPDTWAPIGPLELSGRVDLENIAAAIAAESATRSWGWEGCVRGLLHYLCSIVIRRLDREGLAGGRVPEPPAIQADPRTWTIVRSVLEYCEANYRKGIGLAEVAAALGYTPSYLSRLVTRHLGRSLTEHVLARRTEAAKQLLANPQLSVAEVADQLGYSDPSHFSRAFIKATGLSPKVYRQRLGGL
ncbi:MAG: AraC family transcriptional regulator [Armatimonadota bacterium]